MELSCLQSSGVIHTVGGLQNTAQRLVSSQQHFRSKLVDHLLEDAAVLSGNDTTQEEKEADRRAITRRGNICMGSGVTMLKYPNTVS